MNVIIESSKLVKPFYVGSPPSTEDVIPLSIFDKITWNQHVAVVYAYRPPTPPNAAIELGLRKTLAIFREVAGRLSSDANGEPVILLNDEGVRFVESYADRILDKTVSFMPSEPAVRSLFPPLYGVSELAQVQITRFSCGSLVLGFTLHHKVADANATSSFLLAWGQASRNLNISPLPFQDRTLFTPRDPPIFEFEHQGSEFMSKNLKDLYSYADDRVEDIVAEKYLFTAEFVSKIKAKAAINRSSSKKPFTTFESLVAHLWRAVTKARGLNGSDSTRLRISVDGRSRLKDRVPYTYFGNMILWASARSKVDDLLHEPVGYAANLLHEAVKSVTDDYIKSFIDFAHYRATAEELIPVTVVEAKKMIFWPDMEVGSWLRFPFYNLDFGGGGPYAFSPCFAPMEGDIYLMPTFSGDGGIEAYIPLFRENSKVFKNVCYSLE